MKHLMTLLALSICHVSFAVEIECTATDSSGLNMEIVHDLNLNAHGPLDSIQGSSVANAFISSGQPPKSRNLFI